MITAANVLALAALIASLLSAHERSGGELLLKGATIWGTNVITFGLLFWELDRGGPIRRREPDPPPRGFQFPQEFGRSLGCVWSSRRVGSSGRYTSIEQERTLTMRGSRVVPVLVILGMLFVTAGVANAAGAPSATTGAATSIGATAATLNGTVDPNKQSTTYSFQYGPTTAYGKTTPVQTVKGNAGKSVSASVTGLTPSTLYHFRLTATNASGQSTGQDVTFTTTAVGPPPPTKHAVSIGAVPGTVTYGRSAVISGNVTGPKSGGVQVILEAQPYPFTTPFKATGAVTTAASSGRYSFTVAPRVRTRYEVVAKTAPPVTSGAATVGVRYAVSLFVSSNAVHRGARVRFSGSVRPAANGRAVLIQRRSSTGVYRTVARALLHRTTSSTRSSYSIRLRIFATGVYRVRILAHTPYAASNSRSRRISVG